MAMLRRKKANIWHRRKGRKLTCGKAGGEEREQVTRLRREKAQRSNVGKGEGYEVATWKKEETNKLQDWKGRQLTRGKVEVEDN